MIEDNLAFYTEQELNNWLNAIPNDKLAIPDFPFNRNEIIKELQRREFISDLTDGFEVRIKWG